MADGLFYNDLRAPFLTGDIAQVALTTADQALYPVSNFPVLGGQYWNYIGKKMRIRLFGRITTGSTPGNGTWDIYYGNGTNANGTILASSAAVALVASQTNISFYAEFYCHCRTIGSTETLFVTGHALFNNAVIASTNQPILIPATAPVASTGVDLTSANIISVQYKRSGSTSELVTIHDMDVVALN